MPWGNTLVFIQPQGLGFSGLGMLMPSVWSQDSVQYINDTCLLQWLFRMALSQNGPNSEAILA
eukprot:CAMPEP_0184669596 /NCGR_PEP_ID=MMETSP0308-20130426/78104_1 /TAXON_ID=38269 /ORGANISM="Gloeochaete witrockiana, Strain SAG 46.84" /LENGTH=62 /DNA_ID=CAMNT_0027115935 /DNA_START=517 /DNA_END=701 /DNA_ORIENTATION=-